jgi:Zn-dependent peptidase ImmA (M78 family)
MENNKLPDMERKQIEQRALQVLEVAHVSLGEPPIDLLKVAASMGVKVYNARFSDPNVSGIVTTDPTHNPAPVEPGSNATVFVNIDHPVTRRHFTVAHELGHIALKHMGAGIAYRAIGHPYNTKQEREANAFAAGLLMPAKPFVEALYRQLDVAKVALTFGVSVEAATIRTSILSDELELDFPSLKDFDL